MPTNRDITSFFELRRALEGLAEVASTILEGANAGLSFLDRQFGQVRGVRRSKMNGHAVLAANTMRERVKRSYKRRTPAPADIPPPDVSASTPSAGNYADQRRAARQLSLRVLEALDYTEPRQPIPEGMRNIGALVRRGYAKKKGDGYVRTKKVYVLDDGEPATAPANGNGHSNGSSALTVPEAANVLGVSDSYVRLLVKHHKLQARTEERLRANGRKPLPTMVLDRDEIARYAAAAG